MVKYPCQSLPERMQAECQWRTGSWGFLIAFRLSSLTGQGSLDESRFTALSWPNFTGVGGQGGVLRGSVPVGSLTRLTGSKRPPIRPYFEYFDLRVADRVTFEVAKAKEFPGKDYDFVAVFDCLHDMGDPVGAAAHVRAALSDDGSWMIVEPFANDDLQDNLNPVGRVYYSFSTLLCTPWSRSQEVGMCLGAQAGEKRMQKVVTSAGFSRFRRATQTPFNLVYEARP
jgi:hypothetical protein